MNVNRHMFLSDRDEDVQTRIILCIVLSVAAIIRLYHLDTSPLWFDEIWAPLVLNKPTDYILQYINTLDNAPPFFYIITKIVTLFGSSSFVLRLPSVVFGVLAVYLMYIVGKLWASKEVGIFSAISLAIFPAHIYISRAARPYSFCMFLGLLCFIYLKPFIQYKKNIDFYRIALLLSLLLFTVYTSIVYIIFFNIVALIVLVRDRGIIHSLRPILIGTIITLAPTIYFLVHRVFYPSAFNPQLASSLNDFAIAFIRPFIGIFFLSLDPIRDVTATPWEFSYLWHFWITVALLFAGLFWLLRYNRPFFLLGLTLLGATLAFVVLTRLPNLQFWHFFTLYPMIALLAGSGLAAALPKRWWPCVMVGLPLIFLFVYIGPLGWLFYQVNSIQFQSTTPEVGKAIASLAFDDGGIMVDVANEPIYNWYADQFSLINRLKLQRFDSDSGKITLNVIQNSLDEKSFNFFSRGSNIQIANTHIVSVTPIGTHSIFKWTVGNSGVIPLKFGKNVTLDANPQDFYGHVHSADKVMVDPGHTTLAIPTVYDTWTRFEYSFNNVETFKDLLINLSAHYVNSGNGNYFIMTYTFDEEEEQVLFSSVGPELGAIENIVRHDLSFHRYKPFTRLTLHFNIYCAQKTPSLLLSDLRTVGFRKLAFLAKPVNGNVMNPDTLAPEYELEGLRGVERDNDRTWRWGVDGKTSVSFPLFGAQRVRLRYAVRNFLPEQSCRVTINGKHLEMIKDMPIQSWTSIPISRELEFDAPDGRNIITFEFSKINHINASMSDTDTTPYTTAFSTLEIEPLGTEIIQPEL
ncbi:MAG: glycosyltransferase family 39 protein [Desulfovibrio sp.]|nr:glycosyltransferase family 39 protein [Desulfovibrio sp.]MBI4960271.1 glycosyltransferase family 39 protein [Desulfovibrio sp.]